MTAFNAQQASVGSNRTNPNIVPETAIPNLHPLFLKPTSQFLRLRLPPLAGMMDLV